MGPARFQIDGNAAAAHAFVRLPAVEQLTTVEEQAKAVVRPDDKLIAARFGGYQLTGPAHAEIIAG